MLMIYERYLARQIYLAFVFILFAFSGLFFFFDLIGELNSLGRGNYGFLYAVLRVLLLTPSRFYEIIPVAALISAIYVFATMAANSEFTILRISGLSTSRALRTLLKIGVPLVLVTFLIGEVIGPYTDQLSERVRLSAIGSAVSSDFRSGVWVKDTLRDNSAGERITRFVNVGELLPDNTIRNVRIYEFDADFRLRRIRVADSGRFEPPAGRGQPDHWNLSNVQDTELTGVPAPAIPAAARAASQAPAADATLNPVYQSSTARLPSFRMRSELTPEILSVLLVAPNRMSMGNLYAYINHLQENHQDAQRYQVALWRKMLYPLAVFVMLVLSLPFAYLHSRAGVVGVKVFGGIMVGMSFQLVNTLFSHIGTLHTWPAPLSAALPGLIYLVIGLIVLRRMDRH
jgi:lipopolysaccharide export system permease protein